MKSSKAGALIEQEIIGEMRELLTFFSFDLLMDLWESSDVRYIIIKFINEIDEN